MQGKSLKQAIKAIERLYDCTCKISRYEKYKDPITKESKMGISVKYEDIYCRISKQSLSKNNQTDTVNEVSYALKLFISPEITILQGDAIQITDKFGAKEKYLAGEGFKYSAHQEVILIKEGKA